MKRNAVNRDARPARLRRGGLAPLELVLWLPVLLMVMALMVNIGTSGAWRVRGEIVARDAIWRTRWDRTGANEPRPIARVWPANATINVRGAAGIQQLDDPAVNEPVVRGPQLDNFGVRPIFDPKQGAVVGTASIERRFPLLPKLGAFRSGEIQHPLLTETWQVAEMGIPANVYRRIKVLYDLPQTDQNLPDAFVNAVQKVFQLPHASGLRVLDQDDEIYQYLGGYVDFHPFMRRCCERDPDEVYDLIVAHPSDHQVDILDDDDKVLLGQISMLPRRLTNFFLSMYRSQLTALNQQNPPPQGQINSIQEKIDQLEAFQRRLPGMESKLRSQSRTRLLGGS